MFHTFLGLDSKNCTVESSSMLLPPKLEYSGGLRKSGKVGEKKGLCGLMWD